MMMDTEKAIAMLYGPARAASNNAYSPYSGVRAGVKPGTIKTLVVYASGFKVLAPCGACRQVMSELLANDAVIISCQSDTDFQSWSIAELLPDAFVLG